MISNCTQCNGIVACIAKSGRKYQLPDCVIELPYTMFVATCFSCGKMWFTRTQAEDIEWLREEYFALQDWLEELDGKI